MSALLPTVLCLAAYFVAFKFYARFLSRRIFDLDANKVTPAHALEDGVDYVPTRRSIVFGHHYASITGLAPMLGARGGCYLGLVARDDLGGVGRNLHWLRFMIFSALVVFTARSGQVHRPGCGRYHGPEGQDSFSSGDFLWSESLPWEFFVFVIGKLFSVQIDADTAGYPGAVNPFCGFDTRCAGHWFFAVQEKRCPWAYWLLGLLL